MLALFGLLLYACRAWDYGHALVCQQTSGSERWRWRMRKLTCAMTASKCRAMVGPAHWYPSLLGHLHWHHRENLRWLLQPQLVRTVNPVFVSPGGGWGRISHCNASSLGLKSGMFDCFFRPGNLAQKLAQQPRVASLASGLLFGLGLVQLIEC